MNALLKDTSLWAALFAASVTAVGCYPKAGPPPAPLPAERVTWAASRWPNANAESLAAGRTAFLGKCNGCHDYPDLNAVTEGDWPKIAERMGKKADLDDAKRAALLQYILASRHP